MKKITSSIFLLALVLTPVLGNAKENENKNKNEKRDDNDNKSYVKEKDNVCLKAWGHFLDRSDTSFNPNCHIPYGIFKKWNNNNNATTTASTTFPIINSFTVKTKSENKVRINWTTNEKSRAVLFYGTTTPIVVKSATTTRGNILQSVSSSNAMTKVDNVFLSTKGEIDVKNLLASTTYFAVLAVRDYSGNVTVSNTVTFTTSTSTPVVTIDTTAPVISNLITTIGLNKLLVSWKTNEPATSKVFYGTTTLNIATTSTSNMNNATLKTNHSFELPVASSSTSTPYHVILQSTDVSGNTQTSAEYQISFPF